MTRQVGTRKTFQKAPGLWVFSGWVCAVEASLAQSRWHRKRGIWLFSRDGAWRVSRVLARWCPA